MKKIILIAIALFLVGCSQDSKAETKSQTEEKVVKKEPVKVEVKKVEAKPVVEKKEVVKPKPIQKVQKKEVAKVTTSKSGAQLFMACSACHGQNAEKKALTKSKVIQGWSEDKIIAAINGYKDGSYGGPMKGLMKSQVSKLSDADTKQLAKYISGL